MASAVPSVSLAPSASLLGAARRRANRELAAISLSLLALYLWTTGPGLAGTADSGKYLYAARSLREMGRLLMPSGEPFAIWPPLFPALLRVVGGPGPLRWLHAAGLGGAVVGWSLVGRRLLPAGRARALPLLLALNAPALAASKFIWSESVFGLLWAAYFLSLLAWLRAGGWGRGLGATALGCLLPLQRVAGVFLLLGVGVGLLGRGGGDDNEGAAQPGWLARLAHLLVSLSGLLAWQAGQGARAVFGTPTSTDPAELPRRLLGSLADYGFLLTHWLLPVPMGGRAALPALAWAALLGVVSLGSAVAVRVWPGSRAVSIPIPDSAAGLAALAGRLLWLSVAVSLAAFVGSTALGRVAPGLDEAQRYLTPLFPVAALLLLLAWPVHHAPRAGWLARWGPLLLAGSLLYQAARLGYDAQRLRRLPPVRDIGWLPARLSASGDMRP